jgi:hypothetical protein
LWCSADAPEDEAICLFAGLLANPDVPLSHEVYFESKCAWSSCGTIEAPTKDRSPFHRKGWEDRLLETLSLPFFLAFLTLTACEVGGVAYWGGGDGVLKWLRSQHVVNTRLTNSVRIERLGNTCQV